MLSRIRHRSPVRVVLLPVWLATVATLAACGSDSTTPNESDAKGKVTVVIEHKVDGEPLVFDDIRFTNAAGNRYSVVTLKYYLSNVTFLGADGESAATQDAHYIDARSETKRSFVVDRVPDGDYTSARLTFGLDENLNVAGGLPSTPDNLNMEWPPTLGGGYHYMRLEGHYVRDDLSVDGFNVHTGRLGHGHHFDVDLSLPAPLIVSDDAWKVRLSMNVNEWFTHPDDYDFRLVGSSIMEDMEAQHMLRENGADVFWVASVARE